jgi:hypothetical protein
MQGSGADGARRGRIPGPTGTRPHRFVRAPALTLAALAIMLLWVPVTTGLRFPSGLDERTHHIPTVAAYADHLPGLDEMRDTRLPTLPLLHAVLGRLTRSAGDRVPAIRAWMLAAGLLAILLYGRVASQIPGNDWRTATLSLAAFPYFGASYFLVLTEGPGFLAVTAAVLAQIHYWRTEQTGSLWLAGLAGAAACLVQQNLIVVPAVFAAAVAVRAIALGRVVSTWRRLGPGGTLALVLPALALAFQVWLWRGILPPFYEGLPGYYEPTLPILSRSLLSVGANVGYYLLPATLAWAASRGRQLTVRTWSALAAVSIGGAWFLRRVGVGGGAMTGTDGLFRHALESIGHHGGALVETAVVALCLFSFSCVITAGVARMMRTRQFDPGPEFLLFVLLVGTFLVTGFGLTTISERSIVVVYALACLTFLATHRWNESRLLWWGWAASVVFGVGQGIFYAAAAYELVPVASGLYGLLR